MRIAVIGLGLIGGSLLRALAAAGHDVVGFDADPQTRVLARKAGFRIAGSVRDTVAGSEMTALAVPLQVLPGVIADLDGYHGLLTDVTSVKGPVRGLLKGRRFVGGHPMAGKETSGFAAAEVGLFDGCAWVLCLEPHETDLDDWLLLAGMFTRMGARVVPVTAAEHDTAVAQVSHVPHLVASALAWQLAGNPLAGTLAAGSFRDGTRVAGTRAELIAAMCGGNWSAVHGVLRSLIKDLERFEQSLTAGEPMEALLPALRGSTTLRQAWPAPPGEPATMAADVPALLSLGREGGWVIGVRGTELVTLRPESDRFVP